MFKVTDQKSPVREGHKRVRFARHVMEFVPGDIVDVPHDKFEHLVSIRQIGQGNGQFADIRMAIPLEEAIEMDGKAKNLADLTVDEMHSLGMKNIVVTPSDDSFASALKVRAEQLQQQSEEDAEEDVPRRKRGRKPREQGLTSNQLETGDAAQ